MRMAIEIYRIHLARIVQKSRSANMLQVIIHIVEPWLVMAIERTMGDNRWPRAGCS